MAKFPPKNKIHRCLYLHFMLSRWSLTNLRSFVNETTSYEAKKKKAQGCMRNSETLGKAGVFFSISVNKRSWHEFHSCLGTTRYNAYPLPSVSTFTTQSFSVRRQGQLKRLRTSQHRHLYPAILSLSDTLSSILKEFQSSRQEQAQWLCSARTFPLFCIIAFGSEAVI